MNTINIGVLAHVDAGKTTTVEQMLYRAGAIKKPGSVDGGDTQTDWTSVERARGISVQTSSATIEHNGVRINIIDTPGHADFTGEVERALWALDLAVLVISAADGVQPQTEKFWRAIRESGVPCVLFVNKIDRLGVTLPEVLQEIREKLTDTAIPLSEAAEAGTPACRAAHRPLSSLTDEEVFRILEDDETAALLALEGERPTDALLREALFEQTTRSRLCPLLFGAAATGIGIDTLLDAISACAQPADEARSAPVSGIVYKVEHLDRMGRAAHVRLYTGALKNRDAISFTRHDATEGELSRHEGKITQIRTIAGPARRDTGAFAAGEIAAVYGLDAVKAGDIIGDPRALSERIARVRGLAVPSLSVRVDAAPEHRSRLLEAAEALTAEDPLLDYDWDPDERELSFKIMGPIQLEVLSHAMKERYGLDVSFSKPFVLYRETPASAGIGYEEYTMPKPCWAVVKLHIEPRPRGSGYCFESRVRDDEILYRYQNHIALSVPETLKQGLYGWRVTDLKVTLIGGEHHATHTHNMDFFLATPIAVMDGLRNCGTTLLEPMQRIRMAAEDGLAGRLIGDILQMRGEFDSPVIRGGIVHIEAVVPVAASMDYPVTFASLSSGKGSFQAEFHSYRECPLELGRTTRRRGVNPLDRAKWILHKRGAVL